MPAMRAALVALVVAMVSVLRSRASLYLEVLALRHQLAVLQEGARRPRLKPADRLLWVWLSRGWSGWQDALVLVRPRTVISWQRKRFRDHWGSENTQLLFSGSYHGLGLFLDDRVACPSSLLATAA